MMVEQISTRSWRIKCPFSLALFDLQLICIGREGWKQEKSDQFNYKEKSNLLS